MRLSGLLLGAAILAPCATAVTLVVNLNQKYQTIDGFGFSEAFQRAYNIINLPEPRRTELVDLFFNATTGAGFTILRNGLGSTPNTSSDFMNTIAPVSPGNPATKPAYVWDHKDSGQLWVAQQAARYGVKTFYSDAWSAPGFMKTNGVDYNGGYLCGVPGAPCSGVDWRQAYADYLVQYMQFYKDEGIQITHLGFVNEPDIATAYASMQMNGTQAGDFIKVLHTTLQQSANFSSVKIACCEATGWDKQAVITQGLNSAGAGDLVGVITGHEYTGIIRGPQPTTQKAWQTEYSDLAGKWSVAWDAGGPGDGLLWANKIHAGLTVGNLSAYLWWVATQDQITNGDRNEKLVRVDNVTQTYEVSKRFWSFAQFSRNVRPGAVRIDVSGAGATMNTTAFVNVDGSVAVIAINGANSSAPVNVTGVVAKAAKGWLTDTTANLTEVPVTIGGNGSTISASIPARGMVSLVITQG